jgi:hypothetical protein
LQASRTREQIVELLVLFLGSFVLLFHLGKILRARAEKLFDIVLRLMGCAHRCTNTIRFFFMTSYNTHDTHNTRRVPGTSERQPLTYEGVIEPGASGWAGFCAEPARTTGASWVLGTGAIDALLLLPLLLLASGELATTAGIAPDIGRGEPVVSGDMAPDCGRGEVATGGCDQLPAGANEPDDRGPRGELLKSVASICARKRVSAMRANCFNVSINVRERRNESWYRLRVRISCPFQVFFWRRGTTQDARKESENGSKKNWA